MHKTMPFVLVLFCLSFLTCSDDCPTCPEPEENIQHLFYLSHSFGDSIVVKAFSADQYRFVDSFIVDIGDSWDMDIAGDYDKLLVVDNKEFKMINLETKEIDMETSEYGWSVLVSEDSKYYKTYHLNPPKTVFFDLITNQMVFSDSSKIGVGYFIKNTNKYIGTYDTGKVFIYDIEKQQIDTTFEVTFNNNKVSISQFQYIPKHDKLYLIGGYNTTLFLGVINIGVDSLTILRTPLKTGGEDFEVSPDGNHLYFINAPYFDYEFRSQKIEVIDVATSLFINEISTKDYGFFDPLKMSLSSDGKYLLVIPLSWTSLDFMLIDATSLSIIGKYKFSDQQWDIRSVCTKH